MHGPTWIHSHVIQYHQHMIKKLHLIKETSPSVKETRNDGSSMDDIIPYLHHRSAVHFSSPHDQKCCVPLILLMEVLHTSLIIHYQPIGLEPADGQTLTHYH